MTSLDRTLKPCPFCGGEARVHITKRGDGYHQYKIVYVKCKKCASRTTNLFLEPHYNLPVNTPEDAVALWNQRTQ